MTTTQSDVLEGGLREALRRLKIGERRGYRLAAKGAFPFAIRIGGNYVVPRKAFERFLEGRATGYERQ